MIKHLVLFKLKAFATEAAKTAKLNEIKKSLEALPATIKVIKSLEVGINVNPDEDYDIALSVEVETMDDLEIYAKHPDHVACGAILRAVMQSRACVDYLI
ncbi:Stress responsive A/B Barrel Domain [Saccharicrinis carchari]|uniref:Stress responsive A/B Barrel Domain n=1 Tax=Saccharicrinis carchari TaxID=1168039 RepID=A0A521CHM1_SACCC|nr:Dabb family protein [Saccharicrinis carchari]SMO58963.1 Stress responsive A/B Barrel Domain [Saccharicrinis carchari]